MTNSCVWHTRRGVGRRVTDQVQSGITWNVPSDTLFSFDLSHFGFDITKPLLRSSFHFRSIQAWNNITDHLRNVTSFNVFSKELKTHLISTQNEALMNVNYSLRARKFYALILFNFIRNCNRFYNYFKLS